MICLESNSQSHSSGHAAFLSIGWVSAVISLFVPFIGILAIIFGILDIVKSKSKTAGIVLLVFAIIFLYLGLTGFGYGFTSSYGS
ncbi:hypothetical protein [Lentilactobacillus otakiensis]|uniref:hypothetical protein n=1 Tax=Lentilactobacillus otakiensis TaxID=481720 RepID=UPI001CBDC557|nr:hypothetical protein [Lentilactobacillus otakiensis]MDV3517369.1 hypothetical protein [Lentilactobacillus otakiensis]